MEVTDIIFAVDSIPAIFAVTDEVFLVFTANAFAILGLRAMYFLLADLIHRFVYLKAGLTTILGISIVASLVTTRGQARHEPPAPAVPPFRNATPEELEALQPLWGGRSRVRDKEDVPPAVESLR